MTTQNVNQTDREDATIEQWWNDRFGVEEREPMQLWGVLDELAQSNSAEFGELGEGYLERQRSYWLSMQEFWIQEGITEEMCPDWLRGDFWMDEDELAEAEEAGNQAGIFVRRWHEDREGVLI